MDKDKERLIEEIAKVLEDPKLASLTALERARILVDDVIIEEIEQIRAIWIKLCYLPKRPKGKSN